MSWSTGSIAGRAGVVGRGASLSRPGAACRLADSSNSSAGPFGIGLGSAHDAAQVCAGRVSGLELFDKLRQNLGRFAHYAQHPRSTRQGLVEDAVQKILAAPAKLANRF